MARSQQHKIEAKKRMKNLDIDDWPILATTLAFNCPLWTVDKLFWMWYFSKDH